MTAPLAFDQVAFRIRNDNGNETTATWVKAQNTNGGVARDTNFRVRFRIDETGGGTAWSGVTFNLYYSTGGAYAAVTDSTPVKFVLSDNFVDHDDCTTQLTGGTGTFVTDNNGMAEAAGITNSGTKGYLFETEWCLQLDSAQIASNGYVDLRIYNGTGALAAYSQTPRVFAYAVLTGQDVASGVPAVEQPTIAVKHNLTSQDVASGIPAVEQPTIGQKHNLTSQDITSGIPSVETPVIGQKHVLVSQDISSGIPSVEKTTLAQTHVLTAADIASGIPEVEKPTITQIHALTAVDISSGIPAVEKPTLAEVGAGTDNLVGQDISSGIPIVEKPTLAQIHALFSQDIRAGILIVEKPIINYEEPVDTGTPGYYWQNLRKKKKEDEEAVILSVMELM